MSFYEEVLFCVVISEGTDSKQKKLFKKWKNQHVKHLWVFFLRAFLQGARKFFFFFSELPAVRVKSLRLIQTSSHGAKCFSQQCNPVRKRSGWWLITGFTGKTGFSSSSNYQVCCCKQRHAVLPNQLSWVADRWALGWGGGGGLTGRCRQQGRRRV